MQNKKEKNMVLRFIGDFTTYTIWARSLAFFNLFIQLSAFFLVYYTWKTSMSKEKFTKRDLARQLMVFGGSLGIILIGIDSESTLLFSEIPSGTSPLSFLGFCSIAFSVVLPCLLRPRNKIPEKVLIFLMILATVYTLGGIAILFCFIGLENPPLWLAILLMTWYFVLVLSFVAWGIANMFLETSKSKTKYIVCALVGVVAMYIFSISYFIANFIGRIGEAIALNMVDCTIFGFFLVTRKKGGNKNKKVEEGESVIKEEEDPLLKTRD